MVKFIIIKQRKFNLRNIIHVREKKTFLLHSTPSRVFRVSSSTTRANVKICFEQKQIRVNESMLGEVLGKSLNLSSYLWSTALHRPSPLFITDFPRKYKFYGFLDRIELIKNKRCFELKLLRGWFILQFDDFFEKNNEKWRNRKWLWTLILMRTDLSDQDKTAKFILMLRQNISAMINDQT